MEDHGQTNHRKNLELSVVVPHGVGSDHPSAVSPRELNLNGFRAATVSGHELLDVRVKLTIWRIDSVDGWVDKICEVVHGMKRISTIKTTLNKTTLHTVMLRKQRKIGRLIQTV